MAMDRARVLLDINNAIVAHLDLKWIACGLVTSESHQRDARIRTLPFAREQWSFPALTLRQQLSIYVNV
jgi:hypothetical protein